MRRALPALLLLAAAGLHAAPTSVSVQVYPIVNGIVTPAKSPAATLPGDDGKVLQADSSAATGVSWFDLSTLSISTADALSANGANCSAGEYPLGVDEAGAAEDCTTAGDALTSGHLGQFASTSSAQLAGVLSDETGSGALVLATSPTLVTPDLGTPSALVCTNCSGTASGLTAGTASAVALGGITGLGSNVGAWLATPSNANFLAALTGESGTSGAVVLTDSPRIPQCVYTTSDQTAIGTAYADVTGLTQSVAANTNYKIDAGVWLDADAATTGIDLALNGPASPTSIVYEQWIFLNGSQISVRATSYDSNSASPSSSGTTPRMYGIHGILINGSNAGTLAVRAKRENVGSGPNARSYSWLCIQQIT